MRGGKTTVPALGVVAQIGRRPSPLQPASLGDGKLVATFTTLDGIDLTAAAPDGTLFFRGSAGGKPSQVSPKGETSVLASGWPKTGGVAYDEYSRRLFAVVVVSDAIGPASVRLVPVK